MKIKFVEELVGITRKNIRFYEEQGLLSPGRAENGYREYGQEDIDRLMQIKLLRKLGVPIEDIKRVFDGQRRLDDCLDRHMETIDRQKESLTNMQTVGEQIIASHTDLCNLDTEKYLELVDSLEKEGTHFMDVERTDTRKRKQLGAVIAGIVMVMILVVTIVVMLWANAVEPIPMGLILFFLAVPTVMAICIVVALINRIKEIKGGEEDEASKY